MAAAAVLTSAGDGETASGDTTAHDAATIYAQAVTLTSDLTVTGFGIQVDNLATSGSDVTMGLYDDASGAPGSLLVETDQETLSSGTNTLDSNAWVDVSAGDYWIVVNYDAADDTTVVSDATNTASTDTEADGGAPHTRDLDRYDSHHRGPQRLVGHRVLMAAPSPPHRRGVSSRRPSLASTESSRARVPMVTLALGNPSGRAVGIPGRHRTRPLERHRV